MKNFDNYFKEAVKAGINEYELHVTRNYKLSFKYFKSEISKYSVSDCTTVSAKGIFNGKIGYATTEQLDDEGPLFLSEKIKENATFNDSKEKPFIFKGSPNYHKGSAYDKSLDSITVEQKINILKDLESKLITRDYVSDVELSYEEEAEEFTIINSYGLKLFQKSNSVGIVISLLVRNGAENKSSFEVYVDRNLDALNLDELADQIYEKAVSQFGGEPCESKDYKCVLDKSVVNQLLGAFLNSLKAEEVQKKSSVLADKLNNKVMSTCMTVKEMPLVKNVFYRYFDDEGVALENKTLIQHGILKTFVYNLSTAHKDGVQSTGNGFHNSTGFCGITVKPGKKSLDELFAEIGDGIYITNVAGTHSGLNAQSGNFSLQAQGFLIENGKKGKAVNLITIADNLFNLFMNVKAVSSDHKLWYNGYDVPSLYIKKIAVSGK